MTDEQKRALHNASKALIACGMKGDVAHIESLLAAGASEGQAVESIADELATAYGHHLEDDETEAGHWWTFDREALAAFAKRVTAPSASIADTAGAKYTQADMERYGKCYADARDKRRADTAGAKPVAQVDEGDEGLFVEILYGPNGSNLKRGDKLYTTTPAPSVADAAGASESLPENIDWTRVMALAEKHGDGWSDAKGWSFHCDDDLFNFAGELAKESGK